MYETDKPERFQELPEERKRYLLDWIAANLIPIKTFNTKHTSYGIKHLIQAEYPYEYFYNGAFKGAMLEAGYKVKDMDAQNWQFNVSQKSPCFLKTKKLR